MSSEKMLRRRYELPGARPTRRKLVNESESSVLFGRCHCGCGQLTSVATRNDASTNRAKGQPMRYLPGHFKASMGPTKSKLCVRCGTVFECKHEYARYCSATCRHTANSESRRENKPAREAKTKSCEYCGAVFEYERSLARFCSRLCGERSYRSHRRQPLPAPRPCEHCKEMFQPSRVNNKYCSKQCVQAAFLADKPGYMVRAQKRYLSQDPERHRQQVERKRRWNKENADKIRAYSYGYKEQYRVNTRNRRAQLAAAKGSHTLDEVWSMAESQCWLCAYCEDPLFGEYHVDHMVPISRGGDNGWWNLAITCPRCNFSKNAKTAEEYWEFLSTCG